MVTVSESWNVASHLLVQEVVDHLPILVFAGHRKGCDSPVVGRIDVRLVVYEEVYYFLIAVLNRQVDGPISVLKETNREVEVKQVGGIAVVETRLTSRPSLKQRRTITSSPAHSGTHWTSANLGGRRVYLCCKR